MRAALLGAALLAAACASSRPTVSAAEAFGSSREGSADPAARSALARAEPPRSEPAPRRSANPEKWAKGYVRPGECEFAARTLAEESGREVGWTYAKACAARSDFGLLQRLIDNWTPELKTKPEAATVLAQVIAHRGGLVKSDLAMVQQKRLPLFELSAALKQPDTFKGRYLVFVGRIDKMKALKGRFELILAENARVEEDTTVFAEGSYGSASTRSGSASVSGSYQTDTMGSGSGQASGSYSGSSAGRSGKLERRSMTTFEDTGQKIITRLAAADPYLSVDRNFLFLVRFDGARVLADESSDDEEPKLTAVVSLVSYHDVAAVGAFDQ